MVAWSPDTASASVQPQATGLDDPQGFVTPLSLAQKWYGSHASSATVGFGYRNHASGRAWPEYGMMHSHAGTGGRMSNPPTREQDSLVRLSIRLDGSYCTVDLMVSISMVNYASNSDGDAGTSVPGAE